LVQNRDALAELNRAKVQQAESMATLAERQPKITLLLVKDGGWRSEILPPSLKPHSNLQPWSL
jgi:hypothetical protein